MLTFLFSPLGLGCRFHPTCSQYAAEAVRRHGAIRGTALAARRLARCHPWGGQGWDPVPPADQASSLEIDGLDLTDRTPRLQQSPK